MKPIWKLIVLGATVLFLMQSCVTVRRPRHRHHHKHCLVVAQLLTGTTLLNFLSGESRKHQNLLFMEIRDDRELMAIIAKEPEKRVPKSDGEVQGSTVLAHPTTGGSSRRCSRCDTGNFRADIPVVTRFQGRMFLPVMDLPDCHQQEALRLLSQRRTTGCRWMFSG